MPTVTTAPRHGLVIPAPFLIQYYGQSEQTSSVNEPLPTITTRDRHALIDPQNFDSMIEKCGFRMLTPEEGKLAMGFDHDYKILGNKKERMAQAGQAVVPDAATWIISRTIESLS